MRQRACHHTHMHADVPMALVVMPIRCTSATHASQRESLTGGPSSAVRSQLMTRFGYRAHSRLPRHEVPLVSAQTQTNAVRGEDAAVATGAHVARQVSVELRAGSRRLKQSR